MALTAENLFTLPGYMSKGFGAKNVQVLDLVGPNPYAAGGQTMTASSLGMGGFDAVIAVGFSRTGTYYGRVQMTVPADAAGVPPAGASASVKVAWYVTATNAEAGAIDLSQEVMRVVCIGV